MTMVAILSKIFIKNKDGLSEKQLRSAYGTLCCVLGIVLNIVLFGIKYFAGVISASIAITADAFNNLSDAGSSVITLAGIRLANMKPDKGHPFGHGRIEYLSGLAVSVIILVVGFELFKGSVEKIISPSEIDSSPVALIILAASVLIKGYMFFYNRSIGKKINSTGMKATALDCIGDAIATLVVLAATLVSRFTGVQIDGWCGILVSLFIFVAGIRSVKETINPLLGMAPEKEFVDSIERIVMSYDEIIGIHDLIVHDYGPGRIVVSLHAEVDGNGDIFVLHDVIDNAEQELAKELDCIAVIHMDPIETDNEEINRMKLLVTDIITSYIPDATIHDFRMVPGVSHTNVIFDVVVPFDIKESDSEIKKEICSLVSSGLENCNAVVNIDRPFV